MRVALIFFVVTGCFNPDTSQIVFKCDAQNLCPSGLACVAGLCASPQAGDGGTADMLTDMMVSTGCAHGDGQPVGSAWACPGVFSPASPASTLCRQGLSLCTMGAQVDLPACDALGHFFGSAFMGKVSSDGRFHGCTGGNPKRDWYGCGQRTGIMNFMSCNGFSDIAANGDVYWSSPDDSTGLDETTNTLATDGVLCCQ